jgi:acetylornithine deacetylase/succinyl-diaminopimelate desuccinylase-like protein
MLELGSTCDFITDDHRSDRVRVRYGRSSRQSMISRAYHDSLFMARIAPTAMIFIPCKGGVSHRPDEYSTPEQIAKGVAVLAHTLAQLSSANLSS